MVYLAKILLFGEHTILRGSRALAMPYARRFAQWVQDLSKQEHREALLSFGIYLEQELPEYFATDQFRSDVLAGWYLASDIPTGYGAGSSGAVCVAVYDRYATPMGQQARATENRGFWASMEGFFHGTSSGTDPLIIFQNKPILLHADGTFSETPLPAIDTNYQFFLLDTHKSRSTAPLVVFFTEKYDTNATFRQAVDTEWMPANERAIDHLLSGQMVECETAFRAISVFQLNHLPPMVLPKLRPIWEEGLQKELYQLKICGAGGGGYCLGLTQNWEATKASLADWTLEPLF